MASRSARSWRLGTFGLLEGTGRGLPRDPPPALLGAQDRERAERVAEVRQRNAKQDLHQIWMAPGRAAAEKALDTFAAKYQAKYPKAVTCLTKDREALLAFYDFPAEHWAAHPDHQPHRERLRHRPASHRSQQGLPLPQDGARDGLQAGDRGQQDLAPPQQLREVAPGHPGRQIHRRPSGRRNRNPRRRLIMSSPTFDHSSQPINDVLKSDDLEGTLLLGLAGSIFAANHRTAKRSSSSLYFSRS